ncbi:hypothetical protein NEUTE1DRAFT_132758 [Neurospora tetrasperma FGSC 2508]|uniref:Integral membrane protein n=1 Tax=Neurospora tetrasperma (strain FGSC 2508 / ATCC MYA-4615 / P0657) TaxID=510951 RepID=F8MYW5_NEUT8|nr:uncharacterized protein NEUTE1DRAFT_132758 [Neurospora tetrasperma FGSC 2508]EGO51963.1 hypothetical protein NEUTE1DRAFT_132758 [Neurospora tetrasperma FGSC 2508]
MAAPVTTVFPTQSLPACVTACGPLYDVNGACATATAAANVLQNCFCGDARLAPFSTGTAGVCDGACAATPTDLARIQAWYTGYCKATATSAAATSTSTAVASKAKGGGGTWVDNHYQWIIFLVIIVVAIVGIWIGACFWRRAYLRKRDRRYALDQNLAHTTESGRVVPNDGVHVPGATMFSPAPIAEATVFDEKPKKTKKKWTVNERT